MIYLTLYENFEKITFDISDSEYTEIFNKCCKGVDLDKDIPIYRSLNELLTSDYYLIDPRKYERSSSNTNNYYTLIIDNENEWNDFPKRKHGVISSLNESYMGNEFRVIPLQVWDKILIKYGVEKFETPKWGICPSEDIWNSFVYFKWSNNKYGDFSTDADGFNNMIDDICDILHINTRFENFEVFQSNMKQCTFDMVNSLDVSKIYFKKQYEEIINFMIEKNISNLYDLIKYVYTPEGFEVMTYQEIQKKCNRKQQNEVWTDTPVLYLYVSMPSLEK